MREKLEAAWDAYMPPEVSRYTYDRLLDIGTPEAFLAAAMMLVPEGWAWKVWSHGYAELWTLGGKKSEANASGDGPAEALLAAIEKVRT